MDRVRQLNPRSPIAVETKQEGAWHDGKTRHQRDSTIPATPEHTERHFWRGWLLVKKQRAFLGSGKYKKRFFVLERYPLGAGYSLKYFKSENEAFSSMRGGSSFIRKTKCTTIPMAPRPTFIFPSQNGGVEEYPHESFDLLIIDGTQLSKKRFVTLVVLPDDDSKRIAKELQAICPNETSTMHKSPGNFSIEDLGPDIGVEMTSSDRRTLSAQHKKNMMKRKQSASILKAKKDHTYERRERLLSEESMRQRETEKMKLKEEVGHLLKRLRTYKGTWNDDESGMLKETKRFANEFCTGECQYTHLDQEAAEKCFEKVRLFLIRELTGRMEDEAIVLVDGMCAYCADAADPETRAAAKRLKEEREKAARIIQIKARKRRKSRAARLEMKRAMLSADRERAVCKLQARLRGNATRKKMKEDAEVRRHLKRLHGKDFDYGKEKEKAKEVALAVPDAPKLPKDERHCLTRAFDFICCVTCCHPTSRRRRASLSTLTSGSLNRMNMLAIRDRPEMGFDERAEEVEKHFVISLPAWQDSSGTGSTPPNSFTRERSGTGGSFTTKTLVDLDVSTRRANSSGRGMNNNRLQVRGKGENLQVFDQELGKWRKGKTSDFLSNVAKEEFERLVEEGQTLMEQLLTRKGKWSDDEEGMMADTKGFADAFCAKACSYSNLTRETAMEALEKPRKFLIRELWGSEEDRAIADLERVCRHCAASNPNAPRGYLDVSKISASVDKISPEINSEMEKLRALGSIWIKRLLKYKKLFASDDADILKEFLTISREFQQPKTNGPFPFQHLHKRTAKQALMKVRKCLSQELAGAHLDHAMDELDFIVAFIASKNPLGEPVKVLSRKLSKMERQATNQRRVWEDDDHDGDSEIVKVRSPRNLRKLRDLEASQASPTLIVPRSGSSGGHDSPSHSGVAPAAHRTHKLFTGRLGPPSMSFHLVEEKVRFDNILEGHHAVSHAKRAKEHRLSMILGMDEDIIRKQDEEKEASKLRRYKFATPHEYVTNSPRGLTVTRFEGDGYDI